MDRYRAEFLDLVKNEVDILFANQNELMALYQTKDIDQAIAALTVDGTIDTILKSFGFPLSRIAELLPGNAKDLK